MIGIVDYGMGNLLSVYNAFDYLAAKVTICQKPEDLDQVDKIVIPGVGAFKNCMDKLGSEDFIESLNEHVRVKGKPTLGICLGMQIMATKGYEGLEYAGLNWFDAEVIRLHPSNSDYRIPNIGWEEVTLNPNVSLFKGIPVRADFYLVHSYYMSCRKEEDVIATYNYGQTVTAAVLKDNIVATQFHPEKSQDNGLKFLDNFIHWNP